MRLLGLRRGVLLNRGQIVEHPEGSAVGRQDQRIVPRMDRHLVDRHGREIGLDPEPRFSTVGGDEEAGLGADIEHVGVPDILADRPDHLPRGQIARDRPERRPVVLARIYIGAVVAHPVIVERHIHRALGELRWLHLRDVGPFRGAGNLGRHAAPGGAAIARDLRLAVIRPGIQQPLLHLRLGHREQRPVHRHAVILGDLEFLALDAHQVDRIPVEREREIRAHRFPRPALVSGLEEFVGAGVNGVGIMRRDHERRVPVPPERLLVTGRLGPDTLPFVGDPVDPRDVAILRFGVDDPMVGRIDQPDEAVAALGHEPVVVRAPVLRPHLARPAPGVVVLEPAADIERGLHVIADMVELADRNVREPHPLGALVVADPDPAVAADHQVFGIGRVDPHGVIVHVDLLVDGVEGLPAIVRHQHVQARDVDPEIVLRIDPNHPEIHRPRVGAAHLPPGGAGVVASVDPALLLVLDPGVDDARVGEIDRDPAPAPRALGQSLGESGPGPSGVGRFPEAAAWAATVHAPGGPAPLIGGRVKNLVVGGIHHQFGAAGVHARIEHPGPGETAVGRLVDAAVAAGLPEIAEGRDVDDIGIDRVDHDPGDLLRGAEPHVLPGLATVGRFVDPVAPGGTLPVVVLAGADPDQIGIVRRDGDGPDRP